MAAVLFGRKISPSWVDSGRQSCWYSFNLRPYHSLRRSKRWLSRVQLWAGRTSGHSLHSLPAWSLSPHHHPSLPPKHLYPQILLESYFLVQHPVHSPRRALDYVGVSLFLSSGIQSNILVRRQAQILTSSLVHRCSRMSVSDVSTHSPCAITLRCLTSSLTTSKSRISSFRFLSLVR